MEGKILKILDELLERYPSLVGQERISLEYIRF